MVAFEVAKRTHVGMVRTNNEDAILEHRFIHCGRTFRLLAVADGMGGGPAGEVASRVAIDTLRDGLEADAWANEKAALTSAFWGANAAVHAISMGRTGGAGSRMGTTLVAALVDEDTARAWVANVGDSRCYLLTHDGLEQVTEDHSALAEMRRMDAPRGNTARFRNVVTRAIGPEPQVIVDVFGPRQLNPGERLLLCSDGLTNMVRDSEIRGVLAHDGLEHAAVRLVNRANEHGGKDNVSLVVGGLGGPAAPHRPGLPFSPVVMAAVGAVGLIGLAAIVAILNPTSDSHEAQSGVAQSSTAPLTTASAYSAPQNTAVTAPNPIPEHVAQPPANIDESLYYPDAIRCGYWQCAYTVQQSATPETCSGFAKWLGLDPDEVERDNSGKCPPNVLQVGDTLAYTPVWLGGAP